MTEYRFEKSEPLTQQFVLAIRVDVKNQKEYVWVGPEYEVRNALRGRDATLCVAQTRPLGAFWDEFGKQTAEGWSDAVWALCGALTARRAAERKEQEQQARELLSQLAGNDNAAMVYVAFQLWEMYLRCCQGRDKPRAAEALREYAGLLISPFGEYTPEMVNLLNGKPVTPIWNSDEDAQLQIWYPCGKIPFECAVVSRSLRPMLIYYRQRIMDAGLVLRVCTNCGRIFFANSARAGLCSEKCRKASRKKARTAFEDKAKGQPYEQAYEREYMFWYNRIAKLKKEKAPPEQLQAAQDALKQFRREAVRNKDRVKMGTMAEKKYESWLIEQEKVILSIIEADGSTFGAYT